MPLMNVYFTDNFHRTKELLPIFEELHQELSPIVQSNVENFKTLFIPVKDYVLGGGEVNKIYMRIEFKFLPGRTGDIREQVEILIYERVKTALVSLKLPLNYELSLNIFDIPGRYKTEEF